MNWKQELFPNLDRIVCLVAESAGGKTKLATALAEYGYTQIDSYTTRAKRFPTEGAHTYVTPEEFDAIRSDLIAYTLYDGHEYGATRTQVREKHLYVIDPHGVKTIQEHVDRNNILVVYLSVTEEIRKARLEKDRGAGEAASRILHDRIEFANFTDYDLKLENNGHHDLLRNKLILRRLIRDWYKHED
jgi:guanylate kinase